MAILDFMNNPQDTEEAALAQNPQTLGVLGNIANSVDSFNLGSRDQIANGTSPGAQDAPQAPVSDSQASVDAGSASTPTESNASQDAPQGDFLSGLAKGFANALANPDVINTLGAFGDSLAGDKAGYQANMNAYTQRMDARRQEAAAQAKSKADQSWREQQALTNSLYDQYTPESVANFRSSGDYTKLVPNQKYTQSQQRLQQADTRLGQSGQTVDISQQNANTRQQQVAQTGQYQTAQLAQGQQRLDDASSKWGDEKQLKAQDKQDKEDAKSTEQWEAQQKTIDSTESALSSAKAIVNDENFDGFFGPVAGRLPNITPGSQALSSRFTNLKSQQFLQGIQSLKGMGALSDAEGAKISAAQGRIFNPDGSVNQKISAAEARDAVNEIVDTYQSGLAKARAIQGTQKAPKYAAAAQAAVANSGLSDDEKSQGYSIATNPNDGSRWVVSAANGSGKRTPVRKLN